MSILKVARMGHPVLRAVARPVTAAEIASPGIQQLIDDMAETMHEYSGIGLAAPQVHAGVRIFLAMIHVDRDPDPSDDAPERETVALINPELTLLDAPEHEGWEGCLSIPDVRGKVPRAKQIRVRALDRDGARIEFGVADLSARVIQHENDHLDGVLFFDRMKNLASLTFMDEFDRFWRKHDDDDDDNDE